MELERGNSIPKKTVIVFFFITVFIFFFSFQSAQAGKSSAGKLLFFPCDKCHPLGEVLPNEFEGHKIKLEGHDKLGEGNAACFVCHQSVDNPDSLILVDGGLVGIDDDASKVCYRCHSDKYGDWEDGLHGKQPGCMAKGCHNPHSPAWIAISPIPPFLGTTQEIKVVGSSKEPFLALPIPPKEAEPESLPIAKILAFVLALGVAGSIGGSIYIANSGIRTKGRK